MCVINKADGNMLLHAQNTHNEYKSTSQFWRSRESRTPPVLLCSSITGEGMRGKCSDSVGMSKLLNPFLYIFFRTFLNDCDVIFEYAVIEIWQEICKFRQDTTQHDLLAKRGKQAKYWTWKRIQVSVYIYIKIRF